MISSANPACNQTLRVPSLLDTVSRHLQIPHVSCQICALTRKPQQAGDKNQGSVVKFCSVNKILLSLCESHQALCANQPK